jgi:hypothetical protein
VRHEPTSGLSPNNHAFFIEIFTSVAACGKSNFVFDHASFWKRDEGSTTIRRACFADSWRATLKGSLRASRASAVENRFHVTEWL